jgi:single-strand DNA-binding protein
MKDLNKMILIGRLGADPVLRVSKHGQDYATFPVATSKRVKDEGENYTEKTQWHRVVVFDQQAKHCAQYLKKGYSVYVEGSLSLRKFTNKEGVNGVSVELIASDVNFLSMRIPSVSVNEETVHQSNEGVVKEFTEEQVEVISA